MRFQRRFSIILTLLVSVVIVAAAADYPLTVVDDTGYSLIMTRRPTRIISLAPSNTEILFALGLGKQIVGVTNYCDYPAAAAEKERIGDLNLNYEKIVALQPDLILGVASMQAEDIKRLRSLGLPVFALNPTDLASTMAAIMKVARVTGCETAADELTAEMKRRIEAVRKKLAGLSEAERPRVFVEIWMDPLMTAGPGTFTAELIDLAGGKDIAWDARPWSTFSQELILMRNPQVIISQCDSAADIVQRPGWSGIDAVRSGRVYDVDQDVFSRSGPRLVEALEILAKLLHAERFS